MSKLNLTDLSTITGNETSAINTINNNSALIETFSDNTISRDGTTPNTMLDDFDMNSNRILNLPTPASALEPLRLQDLSDFIGSGTITTGAPTNASYVTLGTNATLSAERVLTAGSGITLVDGGAGSTLTASVGTVNVTATGTITARSLESRFADVIFLSDFGAVADANNATRTVSITSGTGSLTVAGASFVLADVGKIIQVSGAGAASAPYFGTITAFTSSTQVTVSPNASTTLTTSSQTVTYGTDNSTAIQSWITAGANANKICWFNSGNYCLSTAITSPTISSSIYIQGEGRQNSVLWPLSTANCFTLITNNPITFKSFGIFASQTQGTLGTLLSLGGSGSQNFGSLVDDVYFVGGNTSISADPVSLFKITDSYIGNAINNGIILGNSFLPSSGGYLISNCNIGLTQTASVRQTGLFLRSGGNLQIVNSLIHFCNTAVTIQPNQSGVIGNIFFNNVSFEQNDGNCVVFNKGSSSVIQTITFSGCDFGGGTPNGIVIGQDSNADYIGDLTITGCLFYPNGGTGIFVSKSTNGVTSSGGINIIGNVFRTGGGTNTGINLTDATSSATIANNFFASSITTPITNSSTNILTRITNNQGYNPIGLTAAATMGASPTTITAGASPETHYVRQSATNTATIAKGSQQVATLAGATTYYTIELGPHESYVTTWVTTAPTYTKDIH